MIINKDYNMNIEHRIVHKEIEMLAVDRKHQITLPTRAGFLDKKIS